MLTYPGSSAVSSVRQPKAYYPALRRESGLHNVTGHNYDSASFSSVHAERSAFMDTVSRLSQEVRTATTTGAIQELRQQVSSGAYTPDPNAIAGKILFLVEE